MQRIHMLLRNNMRKKKAVGRDSASVASSYQITKALCLTENYNCDTPVC